LNGTYATTGSNTFAGIQTVNSNLIVTGSITAQTLVVQTITSSVDFVTGSTRFGSISENTHQFTGSVSVSGSTNLAGSLTVNKVAINSGNLNLASFPSLDLIVSGGIGFSSGGSGAAALVNRDGSGNITFYGSSGDIKFTDVTFTSNYLTIKSAGNVGIGTVSPNRKFSVNGDITATDSTNNWDMVIRATSTESSIRSTYSGAGGFNPMTFYTTDTKRMQIYATGEVAIIGAAATEAAWGLIVNEANNNNFIIYAGGSGTATKGIILKTTTGTTTINALALASSGAATFSSANQALGGSYSTTGNVLISTTDSFAINKGGSLSLGGKYNTAGTPIETFARIHGKKENSNDGDTAGYLAFETVPDATALLTERMRITSGGEVSINNTSTTARFNLFESAAKWAQIINHTRGAGQFFIQFQYNGSEIGAISGNSSNTTYATSSDYRLKEDLKDFNGLDLVSKLNVYDFAWKSDNTRRMYGVLAHEMAELLPYAVNKEKDLIKEDGSIDVQGVDYSLITPLLVKAIQELKAENDTLKEILQRNNIQ
jgi:hypothetical protein